MKLSELLYLFEEISLPDFYNKPFSKSQTFVVNPVIEVSGKKVTLEMPIDVDMHNINKEVEDWLTAPPEVKKKFEEYAYWYDNFNKLVFENFPSESDACLFLAACAYCSVNTALDQNILEAAKLYKVLKHDVALPGGKEGLLDIAKKVKSNLKNEYLEYLRPYVEKGFQYAELLLPKLDYKGGKVSSGPRKGEDDIFSEITVSNAKIPNFHKYVEFYVKYPNITKDELEQKVKSGELKIGGTKVGSFFMNLIFPGVKWHPSGPGAAKLDAGDVPVPATIDRWMIRVFFDRPIQEMVEKSIDAYIQRVTDETKIKPGKKDTPETIAKKRKDILEANRAKITDDCVMSLFSNDKVRRNLIDVLVKKSREMGLDSYQLQALAWVNIRIRYKEPAAKFAKFEDVMGYAEDIRGEMEKMDKAREEAKSMVSLNSEKINKVMNTIDFLASGKRFKFKDKQDVIDTIENADLYKNIYFMPKKEKIQKKKGIKVSQSDEVLLKMKVALIDEQTADIFDLGKSKKTPVHKIKGVDRKDVFDKSLNWILSYNPGA